MSTGTANSRAQRQPASPASPKREDFEFAIICALRTEMDAVDMVLDQEWDISFPRVKGDNNFYTTGRIHQHNVVAIRLASIGLQRASVSASTICHSFPNIRLALIVGICGGIPEARPTVYLGDLIVSNVVVQDLGSQYDTRSVPKTNANNTLPRLGDFVANFLSSLDSGKKERKLQTAILGELERLGNTGSVKVPTYPGVDKDCLYKATYSHKHRNKNTAQPPASEECVNCAADQHCDTAVKASCEVLGCAADPTGIERSQGRQPDAQGKHIPAIRVGAVGSSNQVTKSATYRKGFADQDIVGLEMEGAGVSGLIETVVIKAVCDYADSHKNKDWQDYSAMVAAAGMKALLKEHPGYGLARAMPTILSLDEALKYDGMDARHNQIGKRPLPARSFDWVWSETDFVPWLCLPSKSPRASYFWISGKPGSGKSTLMSYLAGHIKTIECLREKEPPAKVVKFFFDYQSGSSTANNREGLIKSFLYQLSQQAEFKQQLVERHERQTPGEPLIQDMDENQLVLLFSEVVKSASGLTYGFVDGVDEYTGTRADLLDFLQDLQDKSGIKLCVASREEDPFTGFFRDSDHFAMHKHNSDSVSACIRREIDDAGEEFARGKALLSTKINILVERAEGVILWARFAAKEILSVGPDVTDVEELIAKLPKELEEIYDWALDRIPHSLAQKAAVILAFINAAGMLRGPTTLAMVFDLCSTYLEPSEFVAYEDRYNIDNAIFPFTERLFGLLGPFLDLIHSNNDWVESVKLERAGPRRETYKVVYNDESAAWYDRLILNPVRQIPGISWIWGRHLRDCEIRLMHKSLQPYIASSPRFQSSLPGCLRNSVPREILTSIITSVMSKQWEKRHGVYYHSLWTAPVPSADYWTIFEHWDNTGMTVHSTLACHTTTFDLQACLATHRWGWRTMTEHRLHENRTIIEEMPSPGGGG